MSSGRHLRDTAHCFPVIDSPTNSAKEDTPVKIYYLNTVLVLKGRYRGDKCRENGVAGAGWKITNRGRLIPPQILLRRTPLSNYIISTLYYSSCKALKGRYRGDKCRGNRVAEWVAGWQIRRMNGTWWRFQPPPALPADPTTQAPG